MKQFITFDLYGTLLDIKGSIIRYFKNISNGRIDKKKAATLFDEWNSKNFANINSKQISFKDSATETLLPILRREGLDDNIGIFLEYYADAKPFPEVFDALRYLKQNHKLAIISNIDNYLVVKNALAPFFDVMITAEDAGFHYKPQKEIFDYALKRLGCKKDDILHIASSVRADLNGVVPLGWDMVLINRDRLDYVLKPMKVFDDLKQLSQIFS